MIFWMERRYVKVSGDIEGSYVIEAACTDGRLVIAPDTSAEAIMKRLGHEPATPAEFEAVYVTTKLPDGER